MTAAHFIYTYVIDKACVLSFYWNIFWEYKEKYAAMARQLEIIIIMVVANGTFILNDTNKRMKS
jgi:hypothetical protein